MMEVFCYTERYLFEQRAATCRVWAFRGVPWGEEGEEAETLRACPFSETPRYPTWAEQAAVWDRAAAKARKAGEYYRSAW